MRMLAMAALGLAAASMSGHAIAQSGEPVRFTHVGYPTQFSASMENARGLNITVFYDPDQERTEDHIRGGGYAYVRGTIRFCNDVNQGTWNGDVNIQSGDAERLSVWRTDAGTHSISVPIRQCVERTLWFSDANPPSGRGLESIEILVYVTRR